MNSIVAIIQNHEILRNGNIGHAQGRLVCLYPVCEPLPCHLQYVVSGEKLRADYSVPCFPKTFQLLITFYHEEQPHKYWEIPNTSP